jgi:UDP-N-acetylglucosamine--N-acetylmuramyl-(pentapeptide) pyrophosphoryl-undecaprenol N-acetylglucosamine transferase
MSSERPVMIMAGGTGGHIFPGLAVADSLRELNVPVVWLGSRGGMEERLVPASDIQFDSLLISALRGKGFKTLVLAPFRLLRAVFQAMAILRRHQPRCVLSMGGFAAGPGGLAAWLSRRPLVVHEQNRIPGLTNRVLSRLAKRVMGGFPDCFPVAAKIDYVGNPVRESISVLAAPEERLAGRKGATRLLVLGGSQGARVLNQTLPRALAQMAAEERPEVRHQLGQRHLAEGRQDYAEAGVEASLEPFIEDMAAAYAWADLVVCRAGALTIAELCAAGVGALLVPYPHAVDDHQTRNAEFMVAGGAAELIPEASLNPRLLFLRLHSSLSSRKRMQDLASNARFLARPDAAQRAAEICLEVGR